ncbi:hypothetical protein HHI36_008418 [Cryptolaemus montrouzieri]|uniref:Lipase domain-containing protein n=1 Tax=Cryptolaemus montrouzieri TaxID=559131 RepID=A0ABD2MSI7_9CUCU
MSPLRSSPLLSIGIAIQPEDVFGVIFRDDAFHQFVRFDTRNVSLNTNSNNPIIFIIHGWMEDRNVEWFQDLTEAFLEENKANIVIQVDWSKGSKLPRSSAVRNNKPVGEIIGKFIYDLMKTNSLSPSQFHLVGFSMGGQVSGFAAKEFVSLSSQKLGRITALDPSGKSYNDRPENERLNSNDAEIVAVIHTDTSQFGFKEPCGTHDLYPNGRVTYQPGCPDKFDLVELAYCSHFRAHRYFIEAIKQGRFIGTQCETYEKYREGYCGGNKEVNFADVIYPHQSEVYYAITKSKPPFLY